MVSIGIDIKCMGFKNDILLLINHQNVKFELVWTKLLSSYDIFFRSKQQEKIKPLHA